MSHINHEKLLSGSSGTSGNARLYLVVAVVCAGYILSANLKSIIFAGWNIRQFAPLVIVIVIFAGVIQTLLNKPKSLTNLGIIGKMYFVLAVTLHAINSTAIGQSRVNIGAGIYIIAVLYLAMVDTIPSLRERASLSPVGVKGAMARIASFTLPLALLFSMYLVWVLTTIPREVRSLRTVPYQEMLDNHGVQMSEDYRWEDQLKVYLKKDMLLKTELSDGTSVWKNDDGEMLIYRIGTVGEDYARFGFNSPYDFERVIWNAGITQFVPLIMKNMLVSPNESTIAYHLESDRLNAIVVTMELSTGNGFAEFRMHPKDGTSYTMTYSGPIFTDTVNLVVMTMEKLLS